MYELRWFFEGTVPARVADWMDRLDPTCKTKDEGTPRDEIYLRCNETIGVKISRGALELKQRTADPISVSGTGWSGNADHWRKYAWPYADGSDDAIRSAFAARWLEGERFACRKTRVLRKFDLTTGTARCLDASVHATAPIALLVELANVTIEGRQWWTLQFELAMEEMELAPLSPGVSQVLATWPREIPLAAGGSMSYPALLEKLCTKE